MDSDRFTEDPKLRAVIAVALCFLVILIFGVVIACCCQERIQSLRRGGGRSPCTKCQLIDMGEAACYTGYCPDCGDVPPSLRR